uniref:Uncharacterized protein n=1 Tax=Arundo donax TaxID=35708 RepID=A0A0A9EPT7_ARUDO
MHYGSFSVILVTYSQFTFMTSTVMLSQGNGRRRVAPPLLARYRSCY